jgi:hypothetical protein
LLAVLVAATKILFEEQALVTGTKAKQEGWVGDKAGWLARHSGLPAFCAQYYHFSLFQVEFFPTNIL